MYSQLFRKRNIYEKVTLVMSGLDFSAIAMSYYDFKLV